MPFRGKELKPWLHRVFTHYITGLYFVRLLIKDYAGQFLPVKISSENENLQPQNVCHLFCHLQ